MSQSLFFFFFTRRHSKPANQEKHTICFIFSLCCLFECHPPGRLLPLQLVSFSLQSVHLSEERWCRHVIVFIQDVTQPLCRWRHLMEGKDVFDIIRICICFKIPEDLAKNSPKTCDRCFTDFFLYLCFVFIKSATQSEFVWLISLQQNDHP